MTPPSARRRRPPRKAASLRPGDRPRRSACASELRSDFEAALVARDGLAAAHCVHELWMRGEAGAVIDPLLERLWPAAAPGSIPDWLPMRHVDWLPLVYDVASRFRGQGRGRCSVYLVLLDFADSRAGPHGIYVGMTHHTPQWRFDQHKAGIRASGSVLKRGLELLEGPALHLRRLPRSEAARIESQLAEALRAEGLLVKGGH